MHTHVLEEMSSKSIYSAYTYIRNGLKSHVGQPVLKNGHNQYFE